MTAVILCSLTVLFIQQSQYAKRWRPAIPVGLEDISQYHTPLSKLSYQKKQKNTSYLRETSKGTNLFLKKAKNLAADDEVNDIYIQESADGSEPDTGHMMSTIKNPPLEYKRKTSSLDPQTDTDSTVLEKDSKSPNVGAEFTSPLIITENDWPLNKHFKPISVKRALGLSSSSETSVTRPIKLAYIRHCKEQDPECVEQKPMNFAKHCPYPGLEKTEDWNTADIIVINVWRVRSEQYVPNFRRPPGQIWIMLSVEAPSRKQNHLQLDYPGMKGQFNLTMSYRLDADIPFPYGHLQRSPAQDERDLEVVYSAKRFHAAWLVSHCSTNSKREHYVRRLQKAGLEVHIYGGCGNYSCHDGERSKRRASFAPDSVCMPHLSKNYLFYLSFENTMCKDYMTEKVFKIFDSVDLIPVVMGGADYAKFLPPRTFVNVADFKNARELARYLKRLAKDKKRYLNMLREKNKWKRVERPHWFCALGEKLATGVKPRVLPDTRAWYNQDQCWQPTQYS